MATLPYPSPLALQCPFTKQIWENRHSICIALGFCLDHVFRGEFPSLTKNPDKFPTLAQ